MRCSSELGNQERISFLFAAQNFVPRDARGQISRPIPLMARDPMLRREKARTIKIDETAIAENGMRKFIPNIRAAIKEGCVAGPPLAGPILSGLSEEKEVSFVRLFTTIANHFTGKSIHRMPVASRRDELKAPRLEKSSLQELREARFRSGSTAQRISSFPRMRVNASLDQRVRVQLPPSGERSVIEPIVSSNIRGESRVSGFHLPLKTGRQMPKSFEKMPPFAFDHIENEPETRLQIEYPSTMHRGSRKALISGMAGGKKIKCLFRDPMFDANRGKEIPRERIARFGLIHAIDPQSIVSRGTSKSVPRSIARNVLKSSRIGQNFVAADRQLNAERIAMAVAGSKGAHGACFCNQLRARSAGRHHVDAAGFEGARRGDGTRCGKFGKSRGAFCSQKPKRLFAQTRRGGFKVRAPVKHRRCRKRIEHVSGTIARGIEKPAAVIIAEFRRRSGLTQCAENFRHIFNRAVERSGNYLTIALRENHGMQKEIQSVYVVVQRLLEVHSIRADLPPGFRKNDFPS